MTETHSRASSSRLAGRARRSIYGTAATVAAVALLAGCATGRDAQTAYQKPAIDGVSVTSGTLGIRAAAIQAPLIGASYSVGENAPLVLTLINNRTAADTLTGVTATSVSASVFTGVVGPPSTSTVTTAAAPSTSAAATDSASSSAGATATSGAASTSASTAASTAKTPSAPIPVPANSAVEVGFSAIGPSIVLTGLTAKLWAAQSVTNVVFTFASGASITATLPVQLTAGAGDNPTIDVDPTNAG